MRSRAFLSASSGVLRLAVLTPLTSVALTVKDISFLLFALLFQHFGLRSKRLGQRGHLLCDKGVSRPLGNQLSLRCLFFQSLGGLAHPLSTARRLGRSNSQARLPFCSTFVETVCVICLTSTISGPTTGRSRGHWPASTRKAVRAGANTVRVLLSGRGRRHLGRAAARRGPNRIHRRAGGRGRRVACNPDNGRDGGRDGQSRGRRAACQYFLAHHRTAPQRCEAFSQVVPLHPAGPR
jgi:hypothetical protein